GSLFSTSSVCLCLRLALDSSLFTYTTLFRSGCLVGFVVHGFEAVCAIPVVEDLLWGMQLHDFVDGLVQDSVSLLVFVVWPYWQVFASEFFIAQSSWPSVSWRVSACSRPLMPSLSCGSADPHMVAAMIMMTGCCAQ